MILTILNCKLTAPHFIRDLGQAGGPKIPSLKTWGTRAGLGYDVIVNEGDNEEYNQYLWIHETAHYWQYAGHGYGNVTGQLGWDQFRGLLTSYNPYSDARSYEWQADVITGSYNIFIY